MSGRPCREPSGDVIWSPNNLQQSLANTELPNFISADMTELTETTMIGFTVTILTLLLSFTLALSSTIYHLHVCESLPLALFEA